MKISGIYSITQISTGKRYIGSKLGGPGRHNIPHFEELRRKMSESKKNKPWSAARRFAQENRKQGV